MTYRARWNRPFDIRDYGALPGSATDCHDAIEAALADAFAASSITVGDNAAVFLPPGEWYTSPIAHPGQVALVFEPGAVLLPFATNSGAFEGLISLAAPTGVDTNETWRARILGDICMEGRRYESGTWNYHAIDFNYGPDAQHTYGGAGYTQDPAPVIGDGLISRFEGDGVRLHMTYGTGAMAARVGALRFVSLGGTALWVDRAPAWITLLNAFNCRRAAHISGSHVDIPQVFAGDCGHDGQLYYATTKAHDGAGVATLGVDYHNFDVGDAIDVSSIGSPFNGSFTISARTTSTISYAVVGSAIATTPAHGKIEGLAGEVPIYVSGSQVRIIGEVQDAGWHAVMLEGALRSKIEVDVEGAGVDVANSAGVYLRQGPSSSNSRSNRVRLIADNDTTGGASQFSHSKMKYGIHVEATDTQCINNDFEVVVPIEGSHTLPDGGLPYYGAMHKNRIRGVLQSDGSPVNQTLTPSHVGELCWDFTGKTLYVADDETSADWVVVV